MNITKNKISPRQLCLNYLLYDDFKVMSLFEIASKRNQGLLEAYFKIK